MESDALIFYDDSNWDALDKRHVLPPCTPPAQPFNPLPSNQKFDIHAALPYAPEDDPYPEFTFVSSAFRDTKNAACLKCFEAVHAAAHCEGKVSPVPLKNDEAHSGVGLLLQVVRRRSSKNVGKDGVPMPSPAEMIMPGVFDSSRTYLSNCNCNSSLQAPQLINVDTSEVTKKSSAFRGLTRSRWLAPSKKSSRSLQVAERLEV